MSCTPILKTPEEINIMREAGRAVKDALLLMEKMVKPGVSTLELDQAAEDLFVSRGGRPAFKGYPSGTKGVAPFPGTICASINEEVVHGIPSASRILKENEIISIDVGVEINGFFGDAARTYSVGKPSKKIKKLLDIGFGALECAIKVMRPNVPLSKVSRTVQEHVEKHKLQVVKQNICLLLQHLKNIEKKKRRYFCK